MTKIKFSSRYPRSIKPGDIEAKSNVSNTRILRYLIDFHQTDLGLHKQVSAPELYLLEIKVQELMDRWDRMADDYFRKSRLTASKEACDALTLEAAAKLESLQKILVKTLSIDDRVDWESLKDTASYGGLANFPDPVPKLASLPKPVYIEPTIGFWEGLFGRRAKRLAEARELHEDAVRAWEKAEKAGSEAYSKAFADWHKRKDLFEKSYQVAKADFFAKQSMDNSKIDELARGVETGDVKSVIEHASLVLDASEPDRKRIE